VRKLGNGKFGEVWEGIWKKKKKVDIKKLKKGKMENKDLMDEEKIMKKLRKKKMIKI
jgi:serine/threonine protein kinase